jgi:hypothetical protein
MEAQVYAERRKNIENNWKLYLGKHLEFFKRFPKEPEQHFEDRPKVWENLIRPNIDITLSFLYAKPPRRIIEPEIYKTFIDSMRDYYDAMMLRSALQAFISGYSIAQVLPFDKETGIAIKSGETPRKDDIAIGFAIMPSEDCFPSVSFPTLIPNRLAQLVISYIIPANPGGGPIPPDTKIKSDISHLERITDKEWRVWENRKDVSANGGVNKYNWIPFEMVVAKDYPGEEVGEPLFEDQKPLQLEYNNQVSDISNAMRYHGFPIYFGPPLQNPVISPDSYWTVKPGMQEPGKITGGMPKEMLEYAQLLRQANAEVTGVPLALLGETDGGLGNLESELAVRLIFTRFIRLVKSLQVNFKNFEQQLIRKCIKMGAFYKMIPPPPKDLKVEVIFPEDVLPSDELRELQKMTMKRELGLETQEAQIRKLNPGMSEEDIKSLITEIQGEQMDEQQMMIDAQNLMSETTGGMRKESGTPPEMASGKGIL